MKRSISVFASAAVAAAFFVPTFAFAATINVPADQATIQAAVTAASAGDVINVAAGTYPEQVTVNKSLTLLGANAGIPGNGVRGAESVITGTTTGALQITADNVTIDGFKISSPLNALGTGVHMAATQVGALIKNNLITGNQIGIYANSAGSSTISTNLFDANNEAGSAGGSGIYSEFTDHLTVSNNEFKNHTTNNPIIFAATGAAVHKSLVVSNNNIHDNASGIYVLGVSTGSFTANTISAATATTLSFSGADNNISVTKNLLSNSARGVRVEDAGYGLGSNNAIVINRNSLTGNTEYGVGNITADTALVDATCNWWGAANGPGPVGPGAGDKVTTNVTFSSWLTSSDLTGACNGTTTPPQTLKVHIVKYLDGALATALSANNYLFPMSATWSASNIGAGSGTYVLGTNFGGATNLYGADTAPMSAPADYTTSEVTDNTSQVVATPELCAQGKYLLNGYRTSAVSFADAATQSLLGVAPVLTGLTADQYIIVDNSTCASKGSLVVEKDTIGGNGTFNFTGDMGNFQVTTTGSSTGGTGSSQTFANIAPGTYHVTEATQSGWTMTDNECANIVVGAGATTTCIVTNTKNPRLGEIRGNKFEDWDGDGSAYESKWEVKLSGWTIYLDTNNNGALDIGEPSTITNNHGAYAFTGLVAGAYHVREVQKSGWVSTFPSAVASSDKYDVTLAAGQIAKKKDFGNFKLGTISGMKFNDANGNGKKDSGEVGLAGWTIVLKGPGANGATVQTVTDANGNYSFTNLSVGTYKLSEVAQVGWNQTTHPGSVKIHSATTATKQNFGNTQRPLDSDGDYDGSPANSHQNNDNHNNHGH